MDVGLVIQLCGAPLLGVAAVLSLILLVAALWLVIRAKNIQLLVAFFPLTLLPTFVGVFQSLSTGVATAAAHIDDSGEAVFDSALMLQVSLIPLLVCVLLCAPAAITVMVGRWALAWSQSGLRLFPEKTVDEESPADDSDQWLAKETDDYLGQLVRPR